MDKEKNKKVESNSNNNDYYSCYDDELPVRPSKDYDLIKQQIINGEYSLV